MDAGSVDVDLAPVVAIPIGNEDRVAVVGRVVHQARSIGRPGGMQAALQEPPMFRRNDRREPRAEAIRSHRHLLEKPELRVVVREPDVTNRTEIEVGKASLGHVDESAAARWRDPGVEPPSRSERNAVKLPSGEIAASISSPAKSVSRCTTTPSSGFAPEVVQLPETPRHDGGTDDDARDDPDRSARLRRGDAAATGRPRREASFGEPA